MKFLLGGFPQDRVCFVEKGQIAGKVDCFFTPRFSKTDEKLGVYQFKQPQNAKISKGLPESSS